VRHHRGDHPARLADGQHVLREHQIVLLVRRFGKHVDQELVRRAQQVGELEVLVAQRIPGEVPDQIFARLVRDHPLVALGPHEADVVQHVLQRLVRLAQRPERLVQHVSERLGGIVQLVLHVGPAGPIGHEEGIVVVGIFAVLRFRLLAYQPRCHFTVHDRAPLMAEHVGTAFQEQQPEDVVLVGGRIEPLLPQPVGGGVQVSFEFRKMKFGHPSGPAHSSGHDRCRQRTYYVRSAKPATGPVWPAACSKEWSDPKA
jgi:hypothetical protein